MKSVVFASVVPLCLSLISCNRTFNQSSDVQDRVLGIPGELGCPFSWNLVSVGQGRMCRSADGRMAYVAPTDVMKHQGCYKPQNCPPNSPDPRCAPGYNDAHCSKFEWPWEIAVAARGPGLCPVGSEFDPETRYCVEKQDWGMQQPKMFALGPFPPRMQEACRQRTGGSHECFAPIMEYTGVRLFLGLPPR